LECPAGVTRPEELLTEEAVGCRHLKAGCPRF
jgi:hypothetical protein